MKTDNPACAAPEASDIQWNECVCIQYDRFQLAAFIENTHHTLRTK